MQHRESDVLFQKLGNTWYAFSEINNEIVYSALPEGIDPKSASLELFEIIEDHMVKISNINNNRRSEADL